MDEPVVPTRVDEATQTLREVAAHYRALGQLGVESQPPSDLVTAAWEFLGVVTQQQPQDEQGTYKTNAMIDAFVNGVSGSMVMQVKRSGASEGKWVVAPAMFQRGRQAIWATGGAGEEPEHTCTMLGPVTGSEFGRNALRVQAMRRQMPDEPRNRTPTVRDTVLDVIEPGQEVDVPTVFERVTARGMETSTSVVSNELSRWSRAGVLQRVRRGRYARPEGPSCEAPESPAADPPPAVEEEGKGHHDSAATEGASAL